MTDNFRRSVAPPALSPLTLQDILCVSASLRFIAALQGTAETQRNLLSGAPI